MKRPRIPPTTPPPTAFTWELTVLVDGELGADVDWVKAVEVAVNKIVVGRLVLVDEGAAVDWVKSSEMVMRNHVPELQSLGLLAFILARNWSKLSLAYTQRSILSSISINWKFLRTCTSRYAHPGTNTPDGMGSGYLIYKIKSLTQILFSKKKGTTDELRYTVRQFADQTLHLEIYIVLELVEK